MRKPTIFTINGNNYIIGDWDVDKSLETFVWLVKTFGEGFMSLFMTKEGFDTADKVMSGETDVDDEEKVFEFARKILHNLDPKEYTKYARIIISGTKCNGADIDFKHHFIGRMGELHKVMFNVIKHQYSDFLPEGDDVE